MKRSKIKNQFQIFIDIFASLHIKESIVSNIIIIFQNIRFEVIK